LLLQSQKLGLFTSIAQAQARLGEHLSSDIDGRAATSDNCDLSFKILRVDFPSGRGTRQLGRASAEEGSYAMRLGMPIQIAFAEYNHRADFLSARRYGSILTRKRDPGSRECIAKEVGVRAGAAGVTTPEARYGQPRLEDK